MKVFGCVYHAPDTVAEFLCNSFGMSPNDIHFIHDTVNRKKVQIFLEYKGFVKFVHNARKNGTALTFKNQIVIIFAQPFQLNSWNLTPLDYLESDEPHLKAFEYVGLQRDTLDLEIPELLYENKNYLTKIVDIVSSFDSLLHGLMSFIYTMKSTEQKIAKESACSYLYRSQGLEVLRRNLSPLNDRQIEKMLTILSADVAERIQKAFIDPISIEDRARIYNVSAYELRYIESIASKIAP